MQQPREEEEQAEQFVYSSVGVSNKVIDFSNFSKSEFTEIEESDIQEVILRQPEQSTFELAEEDGEVFTEKSRIIGQLDNTYILIQTDEGLQVVDQHIARERYLYEKLKAEKTYLSQMLLASELIQIEPEQLSMLQENAELLMKYGYELDFDKNECHPEQRRGDFSAMSQNNVKVRFKRLPQLVAQKDPKKVLNDLLMALESSPDTIEDELLIRISCRAAVKAGEKLSLWQMEELISDWQKTNFSKTCPHGRKIGHIISKKEIAGFFGRVN